MVSSIERLHCSSLVHTTTYDELDISWDLTMIIPVSLLANMTDTSTVVGLLGWGGGGAVVQIVQVYMFIASMVTMVTGSEPPSCTWLPWQWEYPILKDDVMDQGSLLYC